jgi:glutathione S-transferase
MMRSTGGFARLLMSTTTATTATAMMSAAATAGSTSSSVAGTPTLKLLGPSFTRAFRCLWMLEELPVQYEIDELVRPQSRRARQYSGAGKVPILLHYREAADRPLVLTESLAINTYLGDTFSHLLRSETYPAQNSDADATDPSMSLPPPPLRMPAFGTLERVKYDQLVCCVLSELDASSLWVHHKHTSPDLAKVFGYIPELAAPCRANFARANRELAPLCRPYLLGPNFTPVDIAYVHCLEWATRQQWNDNNSTNRNGSSDDEEWPAALLDPYLALCRARPAYRRAQRIRKACLLEVKRRQQEQEQQEQQVQQKGRPTDPPASSGGASKL